MPDAFPAKLLLHQHSRCSKGCVWRPTWLPLTAFAPNAKQSNFDDPILSKAILILQPCFRFMATHYYIATRQNVITHAFGGDGVFTGHMHHGP